MAFSHPYQYQAFDKPGVASRGQSGSMCSKYEPETQQIVHLHFYGNLSRRGDRNHFLKHVEILVDHLVADWGQQMRSCRQQKLILIRCP